MISNIIWFAIGFICGYGLACFMSMGGGDDE